LSISLSTYRSLCTLTLAVLVLSVSVFVCLTTEPGLKQLLAGDSRKLLLFAKAPATWTIVKGASGRIVYQGATGAFTVNASGLPPRTHYALVRYADVPPRVEILARGMSDRHGRLKLTGVWKNWTKKFWLVSGEDVVGKVGDASSLRAWRPERYLFEEKQLGIVCESCKPEKQQQ